MEIIEQIKERLVEYVESKTERSGSGVNYIAGQAP